MGLNLTLSKNKKIKQHIKRNSCELIVVKIRKLNNI